MPLKPGQWALTKFRICKHTVVVQKKNILRGAHNECAACGEIIKI